MINNTLNELGVDKYELYLTGKGNFRYNVYPEYKGNRKGKPRPKWEVAVKRHLEDQWDARVVDGMEADDALGIAQCAASADSTIICSIDKDLNQIPGWHYNFVKKEKYYVSNEEGYRYFYYQMVVGDTTDNIKGVVGAGKKAAEKLEFIPVTELYQYVRDMYGSDEEMDLNGKCLWILHKENDDWKNYAGISSKV